jgi:hypothetical protein
LRNFDTSDTEGFGTETMTESGEATPPLSSPPPEREASTSTAELDMPVDEVKVPKDIPPGYAGNAEIYSKAGVSGIDSLFVFIHA